MLHAMIGLAAPRASSIIPRDDGESLRRISDEIARVSRSLASLVAVQSQDLIGESTNGIGSGLPSAATVRTILRHRRTRDSFFNGGLFCDPAWDILLDLLVAHIENQKVSVSSLAIAASVPATTALRWISTMTEQGLLDRELDPFDGRRVHIALTDTALDALKAYFAKIAITPCAVV